MIRFLTTYYRGIKNHPRGFLINTLGFSIGIVAAMFIYVFVVKEYKTDRFHSKRAAIYRVTQNWNNSGFLSSKNFYPLGDLLKRNFSEIENFTRYQEAEIYKVYVEDKEFNLQKLTFVDRSFFEMFDFKSKAGNIDDLFSNPNQVFITDAVAKKYFYTTDVLGKIIKIGDPVSQKEKEYTIAGLIDEYPEESTLQPQIIADIKSEAKKYSGHEWGVLNSQLFLYLPNISTPETISKRISELVADERSRLTNGATFDIDPNKYKLQKLTDLYLGSNLVNDAIPKGDKQLLKILLIVGLVLLITTFVNSTISNLGLSLKSLKSNQIHHALGGGRGWLRRKMMWEGVFNSVLAFALALVFYPLVYAIIVKASDYQYQLISLSDFLILISFLSILVLIGIFSGLIQNKLISKKFTSQFNGLQFGLQKFVFNKLIQFQLVVFLVASISLLFIVKQVKHIQNMELGFDIENTFVLGMMNEKDEELFKQEFGNYSYVKGISKGENLYRNEFRPSAVKIAENDHVVESQIIQGDADYLKTYDIELLLGNDLNRDKIPVGEDFFNWERKANTVIDVLVNEEFVQKAGLKSPIGTIVEGVGIGKGQIVGVFRNVKNLPVYQPIKPSVVAYDLGGITMGLVVSVEDGAQERLKSDVKAFYQKRNVGDYFDLLFWKYDFNKEYKKEQVFSKLIEVFTVVILCILLLGLVGVSIFITEIKTKEIGIRKVNGARVSEILSMLNKDFVKWVAIAFVIATPIAYYAMNKWLENFAYKTTLSWWIFALAGVLALGIALLTVSWQSWRAATRNPVEALRYE